MKTLHVHDPGAAIEAHGPETLSNEDLLTIILDDNELASSIVGLYTLREMSSMDIHDFMNMETMTHVQAQRLAAVFDVSKRLQSENREDPTSFRNPRDVFKYLSPRMSNMNREVFHVLLLNTAHGLISDFVASNGGISSSIVEPRLVFRRAILEHAAAIICVHNHPSGNPEPSREDIAVTRQLVRAGMQVGIPVRDHVIIAGDEYTSLAERGHMSTE